MKADDVQPRLRVRRVGQDELQSCVKVRRLVFILEQGVPEDEELDGRDAQAVHFLAELCEQAAETATWLTVGTARRRVVELDGRHLCKAERVAVLAPYRGAGVGRALMQAIHEDALATGLSVVRLASQEDAVPFYERLGYVAHGARFMDAGIPHFWMDKALR